MRVTSDIATIQDRDGDCDKTLRVTPRDRHVLTYTQGDTEGETTRKHDSTSYRQLYIEPYNRMCWNSIQTRGDPHLRGDIAVPSFLAMNVKSAQVVVT